MRHLFLISLIAIISSCEVKPEPINYGSDGCHFCKMTIVDNQHAAQLVTVKGRAYKYDAIECMMNHLKNWHDNPDVKFFLVTDYSVPGKLVDATHSHYLISNAIPSPMGGFLSAFENSVPRDQILSENEGESLNWNELKIKYQVN